MTGDNDAPPARGSEIPADVAALLARPIGKSRARHARESTAKAAQAAEFSRVTGERFDYVRRYAPDLLPFIYDDTLSFYGAYKLARQRQFAAIPDAELRDAITLKKAARAMRLFHTRFLRDYGQLAEAAPVLALVADTATEMYRSANKTIVQRYMQHNDDAK